MLITGLINQPFTNQPASQFLSKTGHREERERERQRLRAYTADLHNEISTNLGQALTEKPKLR